MRKRATAAVIAGALLLTGCTASDGGSARQQCLDDATSQLPSSATDVNTSKLETLNMSAAMREEADNPLPPDSTDPVLWATTGDLWYREDGKDRSATVLCLVNMKDGQPVKPVEASVTFG